MPNNFSEVISLVDELHRKSKKDNVNFSWHKCCKIVLWSIDKVKEEETNNYINSYKLLVKELIKSKTNLKKLKVKTFRDYVTTYFSILSNFPKMKESK
tara:strand:- start:842 stop:1135 length:294 start_codon:yes stop_codon:yes gene_type:complete